MIGIFRRFPGHEGKKVFRYKFVVFSKTKKFTRVTPVIRFHSHNVVTTKPRVNLGGLHLAFFWPFCSWGRGDIRRGRAAKGRLVRRYQTGVVMLPGEYWLN
jgi:hypothetical protein